MVEPFDSGLAPIVYRIDENDELIFVNDTWRSFAEANDAHALADSWARTSIWSFIDDAEIAYLWRELIARARTGAPISVPYRCDAPSRRRHLQMVLQSLPDGGVEFISTLREAEDRDPVALLSGRYGPGEPIRSCSWCRRFDAGGFVEVEEAIARLGILEQETRPITHVLCEACATAVRETAGLAAPSG